MSAATRQLESEAGLMLTGGVQVYTPGVPYAMLLGNTGRSIRKEPQMNADERRYEYNNIINIFPLQLSTRTHPSQPVEVLT